MKLFKKIFPEIIIFILLSVLFLFKINSSYNFDSDFGRDLMWMFDISHGKITLLGPKLSFGGYYLGPYYYYIFAPFLIIGKMLPYFVIIANALISSFLMTVIFHELRKKTGNLYSAFSIILIAITPYVLFSAREPGNAFSYIPLLLLLMYVFMFSKNLSQKRTVLLGLGTGLVMNFHPVSLLAMIPLSFIRIVAEKKFRFRKLFLYGISAMVLLAPLVLFEVKHGFIMFKNTFIDKSYAIFANAANPASIAIPSNNPIKNLFVIDSIVKLWLTPGLLLLILGSVAVCVCWLAVNNDKKKISESIPFISLIITIILYVFLLRFQVAFHYLFPLLAMVQMVFIFTISRIKNKYAGSSILLLCIGWSIVYFPQQYYGSSVRNFNRMYQDIKNASVKMHIPSNNFNIVAIRNTSQAILGYEYRYMLRLLGKKADDELSYKRSQYLLMVSEKGSIDGNKESSWEINEFGNKELISSYLDGKNAWYLYRKQ